MECAAFVKGDFTLHAQPNEMLHISCMGYETLPGPKLRRKDFFWAKMKFFAVSVVAMK
jgi:hypothetical protein